MKTVLITGANRGIGLEFVKQYCADQYHVIAATRSIEKSSELNQLKSSEKNLSIIKLDVTNSNDIQQLAHYVENLAIDILINNAGIYGPSNMGLGKIDPKSWSEVFNINSIAPLMVTQVLIPAIARSQLKTIANISSAMGSIEDNSSGGEYIYRSSKAALNAATKSLSIDVKPQQIKVVALHPGWVKTDMGGPNALITATESVRGIRQVLNSLTLDDSGSFIKYDGKRLDW